MSYDGMVITGFGAIARSKGEAHQVVQNLIDSKETELAPQAPLPVRD